MRIVRPLNKGERLSSCRASDLKNCRSSLHFLFWFWCRNFLGALVEMSEITGEKPVTPSIIWRNYDQYLQFYR